MPCDCSYRIAFETSSRTLNFPMFEYKNKKPKGTEFNPEPTADTPISPADWKGTGAAGGATPYMNNDAPMGEAGYDTSVEPSIMPNTISARNVLNSDVSVVGILHFSDELLVDGSVEGEITSDGVLTVGANATIIAQSTNKVAIRTKSAIIHGKVSGDVHVDDLVELASDSELIGDITAARLVVHDGAVFIGRSAVGVASSDFASLAKKVTAKSASTAKPDTAAKPAGKAANAKAAADDSKSSAVGDLLS